MLIAREGGFFEQAGLQPSYRLHPSGKRALLESFVTGEVDLLSASDLPVMEVIARRTDLRILAAIQSVRSVNAILARADRGVTTIADLPGRTVGVQELSAVHFFLDRALRAHGAMPESVEFHFAPIETLVGLLGTGEVDAISTREPYLSQGVATLGGAGVVLPAPWVYPQFELLVTSAEFAKTHPEVLARVLQALSLAEQFIDEQPDLAVSLLAGALAVSAADAQSILNNSMNHLILPQSLMPFLEAQRRWISGAVDSPVPGTLLDFFDPAPLLAHRPERVGISGRGRESARE